MGDIEGAALADRGSRWPKRRRAAASGPSACWASLADRAANGTARPARSAGPGMRLALGISYNGQAYQGWQSQLSGRTVQDKLEAALARSPPNLSPRVCAGRTDAGVHGADAGGALRHRHAARHRSPGCAAPTATCRPTSPCSGRMRCPTHFMPRQRRRAALRLRAARIAGAPERDAGRVGWAFRPLDGEAMRAAAELPARRARLHAPFAPRPARPSPVKTLKRIDIAGSRRDGGLTGVSSSRPTPSCTT